MFRKHLSLILSVLLAALAVEAALPSKGSNKKADEFVVVIDAGHGGGDYGAIGAKTNEKSINLGVAKRVRDILAEQAPEIKVVMTRSTDKFVTLNGRADIANKAGGDLFVSIHTNSVDKKNPNRLTVAGASVYTLGLGRSDENLAVAMRENSVMTLEPDYSTTYEGFDPNSAESYIIFEMDRDLHMDQSISAAKAVQNELIAQASRVDRGVRQAGFLVLRATSMPAILIELDFICNPRQESYMASDKGREELGRAIATGICTYKEGVDRARAAIDGGGKATPSRVKPVSSTAKPEAKASDKAVKTASHTSTKKQTADGGKLDDVPDSVFYRIQFMTSPKVLAKGDKRLKGLPAPVNWYRHGGSVKYVTGRYLTEAEATAALSEVRRRYSDAFVIRTKGAARL
ncbi:MAG: N-acetylmuramoyl-L-alanine amidase [Paramuribaculum sp.]|nr:N-acetylmuramoyl-L-alanine amidase [Paramuribaculum sp.]MDE6586949.1 N-acetylmuramoyl-L-alanine amidase [Paramuribaculum sp.]